MKNQQSIKKSLDIHIHVPLSPKINKAKRAKHKNRYQNPLIIFIPFFFFLKKRNLIKAFIPLLK